MGQKLIALALLQTICNTFDKLEKMVDTLSVDIDCNEKKLNTLVTELSVPIGGLNDEINLYVKALPEDALNYRDSLNELFCLRHNQLDKKFESLRNSIRENDKKRSLMKEG